MAEIDIERRPRKNTWTWIALALVLIGVAIGAWLVFGTDDVTVRTDPATETAPAPFDAPVAPPDQSLDPVVPQTEDADAAPEQQPAPQTPPEGDGTTGVEGAAGAAA